MHLVSLLCTRRSFRSPFHMRFSSFFPPSSSSWCSSLSHHTEARKWVFFTSSSSVFPVPFPTRDVLPSRSHAMCCRRSPVPAVFRGVVSSPKRWVSASTGILHQPPHPPRPPTRTHHSDITRDTMKDTNPTHNRDTMPADSLSSSTEGTDSTIRTKNYSPSGDTSHTFPGEIKGGNAENRNPVNGDKEPSHASFFFATSSKGWHYPQLPRLFFVWQQGVVASIGIVMGLAAVVYFFSAPMKEDTVHQTAVLASEALQNLSLQKRAIELSKLVVRDVLSDPNSLNLTIKLVVELLGREEIKVALSSLLASLFEDRYTQEVTKKFILQILRDRWVSDQLDDITKKQIHRLLENQEIKDKLSIFLTEAASDALQKEELHDLSATAIRSTFLKTVNPFSIFSSSSSPQTTQDSAE